MPSHPNFVSCFFFTIKSRGRPKLLPIAIIKSAITNFYTLTMIAADDNSLGVGDFESELRTYIFNLWFVNENQLKRCNVELAWSHGGATLRIDTLIFWINHMGTKHPAGPVIFVRFLIPIRNICGLNIESIYF